jgi:hypothetical protein
LWHAITTLISELLAKVSADPSTILFVLSGFLRLGGFGQAFVG